MVRDMVTIQHEFKAQRTGLRTQNILNPNGQSMARAVHSEIHGEIPVRFSRWMNTEHRLIVVVFISRLSVPTRDGDQLGSNQ